MPPEVDGAFQTRKPAGVAGGGTRVVAIQVLRALAALGVVWFHANALLAARTGTTLAWSSRSGSAGVDLFFIVSGFIMWMTAIDRDEGVREFAIKRIVRIVPLYWLTTSAVLAITLVAPGLMHNASREPLHFLASFFFIAWPHPALPGRFWPPVVPGWTLNYEALFYGVVAISLAMRRTWRLPFCAAVLVGLGLCHALVRGDQALGFYTHPILLEFLFGLLLGATRVQLNGAMALTAIACGALLFVSVGRWGTDENRVFTWGVPLALLALGAINAPPLGPAVLRRALIAVGDASYSLYLLQFLVLPPAAVVAWRALGGVQGTVAGEVLFVTGLVGVALLTGLLGYRLIERPFMRIFKRMPGRRDGAPGRNNTYSPARPFPNRLLSWQVSPGSQCSCSVRSAVKPESPDIINSTRFSREP